MAFWCYPIAEETQQESGDECDIDLDFDGVFVAPHEAFDLEVLLDPFEQQLDLPAFFVKGGDLAGRAGQVIGDQDERGFVFTFDQYLS